MGNLDGAVAEVAGVARDQVQAVGAAAVFVVFQVVVGANAACKGFDRHVASARGGAGVGKADEDDAGLAFAVAAR